MRRCTYFLLHPPIVWRIQPYRRMNRAGGGLEMDCWSVYIWDAKAADWVEILSYNFRALAEEIQFALEYERGLMCKVAR